MRTGNSSGSTSGAGAALTIVNTGSTRSNAVVLTELKTVANPGRRPEHYVRGRNRPKGTCATGLFHLECVFKKVTGNRSRRKFDNYVRGDPLDADLKRKAYAAVAAKLARVIFGLIKHQDARLFGGVPTVCESCRTVAQMAS
jgi:hypothetical protein